MLLTYGKLADPIKSNPQLNLANQLSQLTKPFASLALFRRSSKERNRPGWRPGEAQVSDGRRSRAGHFVAQTERPASERKVSTNIGLVSTCNHKQPLDPQAPLLIIGAPLIIMLQHEFHFILT